jgi:hypothetical protein
MLGGLGTVLDRLQGLFGKGYLIVGLFPVLLLGLVSLPVVRLVAPESPFLLQDGLDLSGPRQGLLVLCVGIALSFIGFLLWMTNSWFRRLLEGRVAIPRPLVKRMILRHRRELAAMEKELSALRPDLVNYRLDVRDGTWERELREARSNAPANSQSEGALPSELVHGLAETQTLVDADKQIPYSKMEKLFNVLKAQLAARKAEELPALGRAHNQFLALAKTALEDIETRFGRLRGERYLRYPKEAARVGPTVLANLGLAHEDHIYTRYGINIEVLWPAISRIVRGDAQFSPTLDEAQIRLDFSVSMATAAMIYTGLWATVLLTQRMGWLAFALVTTLGPIVATAFYRMTVWNAYGFFASVRSAVELFRFDVLKSLHIGLPWNTKNERAIWSEVTGLEELGEGSITYLHP